jgi:hypothetical protein
VFAVVSYQGQGSTCAITGSTPPSNLAYDGFFCNIIQDTNFIASVSELQSHNSITARSPTSICAALPVPAELERRNRKASEGDARPGNHPTEHKFLFIPSVAGQGKKMVRTASVSIFGS